MIGWAEKAYNYFNGKKHGAVPLPASLFAKSGMGIEGYPFDLFISEEHGLEYQVSDHPLQDGSTISDHVHRQLRRCSIEGLFTNRPMSASEGNRDTVKIDENVNAQTVSNTASQRYSAIEELAEKREPVRLVTSLVTYPKMIITSLKTSRDAKTGDCVRFSMELREVVTVTLREISNTYVYSPTTFENAKKRLTASKAKKGKQSAQEKEADELFKLSQVEVAE